MRTTKIAILLGMMLLILTPAPAQAWFAWLNDLSGPGPFNGAEFDFKFLCFMDQTSTAAAIAARNALRGELLELEGGGTPPGPAVIAPPTPRAVAPGLLLPLRFFSPFSVDITSLNGVITITGLLHPVSVPVTLDLSRLSTAVDIYKPTRSALLQKLKSPATTLEGASYAKELAAYTASATNVRDSLTDIGNQLKQLTLSSVLLDAAEEFGARLDYVSLTITNVNSLIQQAAVPAVAPSHFILWGNCSDQVFHERLGGVPHADRHPIASLSFNYRRLVTPTTGFWAFPFFGGGGDGNTTTEVHLRLYDIKLSWPLTGRFDLLDGQTGFGRYSLECDGCTGARGWFIEPVRFDLHVPGSLVEKWTACSEPCATGKRIARFFERIPLSLSYASGLMMFPGGIAADQFGNIFRSGGSRAVSGGEVIFEQGFVINVGRLVGF